MLILCPELKAKGVSTDEFKRKPNNIFFGDNKNTGIDVH
jgi:hypothetical protein